MDLAVIPAVVFSLFAGELETTTISLRTDHGYSSFVVELADEPLEQMRGLMGRNKLGRGEGMLFLYDRDTHVQFWMKNVEMPLDILFADRCGRIVHIHPNAEPDDASVIDPGRAVRIVLEVRAGATKRDQIRPGHQIDLTPVLGLTPLPMARADEHPLPCFY